MISETIVPNDNITVPYGPLTLTRMVFDMLEMDLEIIYDPKLEGSIPDKLYRSMIEEYTEVKVNDNNRPDPKYLEYHNNRFTAVTGQKV